MTQRLSAEFVQEAFRQRGCELLDTYQNKDIPMKFRCKCGKISRICYASFRRGSHCLGCSGKQKHTLQEIKEQIEANGYRLLSKQYKNATTKLELCCPQGHEYNASWNVFQQGCRCPKCSAEENFAALRLSYEEVADRFRKGGGELLSKEYKSNVHKLQYRCSCGNISWITLANFDQDHRCQKCRSEKMSGPNHPGWIKDRSEAKLRLEITTKCFSALQSTFNATGVKKWNKSYKVLGYTPRELRQRVTTHPNWAQVKDDKWHLDHIFPIKAFCEYKIRDIALINCLENLRPLKGRENVTKSGKYNKEDFVYWLKTKGIKV